jgi:hypothetical protein
MEKRLGYRFVDRMLPPIKHPSVAAFTRLTDSAACEACGHRIPPGGLIFRLRESSGAAEVCEPCFRGMEIRRDAA